MRTNSLSIAVALVLSVATFAQVNVPSQSCNGPTSATTVGSALTLDQTGLNAAVGIGALNRAPALANASYLPTGWAINPTANGSAAGAAGFTIEFWYNSANPQVFHYIAGDASWLGAGGAFRIFANGAAGTNNLIVRGPVADLATNTAPLATPGYIHFALRYNGATGTLQWFVNGLPNNSVATAPAGTGTNFTCCGYNGSSAAGPEGFFDEVRCYDYAKTDQDILDHYLVSVGSCSIPLVSINTAEVMVPGQGYYEFELAQNDHTHRIAVNGEGTDTRNRLFTNGTTIQFGGSSAAGNFPATMVWNVNAVALGGVGGTVNRTQAYLDAPAMPVAHTTPGIPALELGHGFSIPTAPLSVAFGDGLGLSTIPGLFSISVPIFYDYNSPDLTFTIPSGVFTDGDRIDIQDISFDPTWPGGIASSNRCTFIYTSTLPGAHFHAEARGVGIIQNTGFFEIWNTGSVNITQVVLDITTCTALVPAEWFPAAALNSGGTLSGGDSYRFGTELHCGLVGGTFTALNPGAATGLPGAIQFDFTDFTSVNNFIFDAGVSVGTVAASQNGSGATLVGMTVTVTFQGGAVLSGVLAADPGDPTGVILDL